MKCTDLQINDWVYLSKKAGYPMRVVEIDKYNCLLDFDGNEGDPFDGIYGEDGIASIPLTDEMLKHNGFYITWETEKPGDATRNYKGFFHPELCISLAYSEELGYCTSVSSKAIYFKHVNEFQHLLRFCGFEEMADNFKIK